MADFGIKPDIALGIKPPATMSLGDMLNVARGAQMYQREQELFLCKSNNKETSLELAI